MTVEGVAVISMGAIEGGGMENKIRIADGPDGEVIVTKGEDAIYTARLAVNLGGGDYLAANLSAKEARRIAQALINCAVGVKKP